MKKITSVLLAVIMMFSLCTTAFAQAEQPAKAYNGDPVIIVRGIHFGGLVHADGSYALVFNSDDITALLKKMLGDLLKGDEDFFVGNLIAYLQKVFDPIASDNEGKSLHPDVHMNKYDLSLDHYGIKKENWTHSESGLACDAAEEFGGENVYFFTYDWRKSPLELSDELHFFIEKVKAEKNSSKVDLAACSMGGMVATAYLYEYGNSSVDSLVYLSSAHNGTHIAGAALTGDIHTSGEYLYTYVEDLVSDKPDALKLFVKAARFTGIFDFAAMLLNAFVETNKERVYNELLRDYLGTSLGLWGLCTDADFDNSVEFVFGSCKDKYPVIIDELAKIKTFVCSTEETIENAKNNGTKISFVSHYNSKVLPIYEETMEQSDAVLECDLTSNYATFAEFGKTLSESHISSVNAEYISPDKMVDASTCLYKDSTWFIKDAPHVGCRVDSDHANLALWLISSEAQPTVTMNPLYPRFIAVDSEMNFIN